MRSTLMERLAVSQDHDGDEAKALGIARTNVAERCSVIRHALGTPAVTIRRRPATSPR